MEKKIHVVFHIRSMEIGGVQKVLLEYLKNLPKDIFDISLITSLYQGELLSEIPQHVRTYYIGQGREFLSQNPWIQKLQLILRRGKLFFYEKFPQLLYQKLHQKPDLEIAFDTFRYQSVINSPIKTSKKIAWLHVDLKNTNADENVNIRTIALMKKFDACVMVSKFAKDNIKKFYNTEFHRCYVIHNPANTEKVHKKANEFCAALPHPCFIGAGRLTKSKGYAELVDIHAELIKDGQIHYIAILGDGPEKDSILQKIKNLGVEKSFLLLGNKINPYPYLKEADFFIHPSLRESYPMVILENMILNKPIISTNVGGIPEIIDNETDGILVNYNKNEILDAMKNFLTDSHLVEKIKNGTKKSSEKFDEHKIYQQVTEMLTSLYNQ